MRSLRIKKARGRAYFVYIKAVSSRFIYYTIQYEYFDTFNLLVHLGNGTSSPQCFMAACTTKDPRFLETLLDFSTLPEGKGVDCFFRTVYSRNNTASLRILQEMSITCMHTILASTVALHPIVQRALYSAYYNKITYN